MNKLRIDKILEVIFGLFLIYKGQYLYGAIMLALGLIRIEINIKP